jgi:uncharacterized protein YggE
MKKLIIILCVLVMSLCVPSSMAQVLSSSGITKTISTNGSAKVWITPNRARLFLGVETSAETIDGARQKNAAIIKQIMGQLESLKLKDIYVQSPTYIVALLKERERDAQEQLRVPNIIGYKVTQKFTVLLKNDDIVTLSKNASLVLDAALQNGVNIIEQDTMFFNEDISKEKEEALKLAIKDAMSKAKVIAETAGMKIKEYSTISSNFYMEEGYSRHSQISQIASPMSSGDTGSTLIAAKIPVEASVSLTCILE